MRLLWLSRGIVAWEAWEKPSAMRRVVCFPLHFPACVKPSYLGHPAGLEEIREEGQAVAYSEGRDEGNNVVLCAAQANSDLTGLGSLW